jgi:predicted esterase
VRSLIAALLLLVSTGAAAEEFKRGEIVDGVACVGHPEITYAYYLPTRYTPQQHWPVLFVFDPRRRGAYAAELFREPAEQFGWIVISSNNTRSDSEAAPTVRAIAIMMPDAQRRFSVDARRNYVAGFSGTAIVAWSLAELTKNIAGVIGSSGRPGDTKMNYRVPFHWFGTAGNRDFNYMETFELDRGLAAAGANHRLEIFDGPHRWAPKEILRQGVAWMEVLAMKAGTRSRDDAIVKQLFAEELAAARAEPDPLAAVRRYESVVRTFEGLIPIDEPVARVKELRASREFAKAVQEEKRAEGLEISYRRALGKAMQAFIQPSDDIPVAPRLAHDLQIESLQRLASKGSYEGLAAQRVLEGIYVRLAFYAAPGLSGQRLAVAKAVAGLIHAPDR